MDVHLTQIAREELRAEEFTKFQAALMWSKKYCDSNSVSFESFSLKEFNYEIGLFYRLKLNPFIKTRINFIQGFKN